MRYVFDISDTSGKQSELTWNFDGDKLLEFMEYQVMYGKYQKYEGVTREDSLIGGMRTFFRPLCPIQKM